MFSIMMTVRSTTIPKSTAPSEMRFAGVCVSTIPMNAMRSAIGMLIAVMSAARDCPRNRKRTMRDEHHPLDEVVKHRVRRELHELAAVVVRDDVHPGREHVVLPDVVDARRGSPRACGGSRRRSA